MMKSSEIKQVALNQLKGKWPKALAITTIFTLVNIALSYLVTIVQNFTINTPILQYSVILIYFTIFLILSFGLISSVKKLIKGIKIDGTTFINDAILNSTKVIAIFIRTVLQMLLPSIIIVIGITGILFLTTQIIPITEETISLYGIFIVVLYLIIFIGVALSALPYTLSSYVLVDNKTLKSKEIIMKSASILENKKFDFVALIFSFIGWILLISILSALIGMAISETISNYAQWIGMIFFMPYFIASIAIFYEEASENVETISKIENN